MLSPGMIFITKQVWAEGLKRKLTFNLNDLWINQCFFAHNKKNKYYIQQQTTTTEKQAPDLGKAHT